MYSNRRRRGDAAYYNVCSGRACLVNARARVMFIRRTDVLTTNGEYVMQRARPVRNENVM